MLSNMPLLRLIEVKSDSSHYNRFVNYNSAMTAIDFKKYIKTISMKL